MAAAVLASAAGISTVIIATPRPPQADFATLTNFPDAAQLRDVTFFEMLAERNIRLSTFYRGELSYTGAPAPGDLMRGGLFQDRCEANVPGQHELVDPVSLIIDGETIRSADGSPLPEGITLDTRYTLASISKMAIYYVALEAENSGIISFRDAVDGSTIRELFRDTERPYRRDILGNSDAEATRQVVLHLGRAALENEALRPMAMPDRTALHAPAFISYARYREAEDQLSRARRNGADEATLSRLTEGRDYMAGMYYVNSTLMNNGIDMFLDTHSGDPAYTLDPVTGRLYPNTCRDFAGNPASCGAAYQSYRRQDYSEERAWAAVGYSPAEQALIDWGDAPVMLNNASLRGMLALADRLRVVDTRYDLLREFNINGEEFDAKTGRACDNESRVFGFSRERPLAFFRTGVPVNAGLNRGWLENTTARVARYHPR
ncbi:MAG: hypothetical protein AB7G06_07870 [Bdellovibrionales bacterium]